MRPSLTPLACPACGGAVPLAAGDRTACPFCAAEVEISPALEQPTTSDLGNACRRLAASGVVAVVDSLRAPRVSPFPAVFQDLSVVVDTDVAAQSVIDAVRDGAGDLLEDVSLFDVYTGPQVGEGRKSLTLALRFRAGDRTLTEDEASAARDAALAVAAERLGAQLRGAVVLWEGRDPRRPREARFRDVFTARKALLGCSSCHRRRSSPTSIMGGSCERSQRIFSSRSKCSAKAWPTHMTPVPGR